MNTSYTPAQLEQFRRDAKRLARQEAIPHNDALDRIAAAKGLKNWSLLAKNAVQGPPPSGPATPPTAKPARLRPVYTRTRHYLHGDQDEGDLSKYFCARCDLFAEAEHFAGDHSEGNEERFLSSLARWTQHDEDDFAGMRRPADAHNLLAASALAANADYEASRGKFHRWIEGQKNRNDPIGDLAADICADRKFPVSAKSRAEVQRHLALKRAVPEAIRALKSAWAEFMAQAN